MTAPVMRRWALFSGSALALAAGVAGVAATTGALDVALLSDLGDAVGDAELLAACGAFLRIEVGLKALDWDRHGEAVDVLLSKQKGLLDAMCRLRPATLAGLRTLADAVDYYEPGLKRDDPDTGVDVRLMAAVLRGALGGVAA